MAFQVDEYMSVPDDEAEAAGLEQEGGGDQAANLREGMVHKDTVATDPNLLASHEVGAGSTPVIPAPMAIEVIPLTPVVESSAGTEDTAGAASNRGAELGSANLEEGVRVALPVAGLTDNTAEARLVPEVGRPVAGDLSAVPVNVSSTLSGTTMNGHAFASQAGGPASHIGIPASHVSAPANHVSSPASHISLPASKTIGASVDDAHKPPASSSEANTAPQKADASIQHEPLPNSAVYAFAERIEPRPAHLGPVEEPTGEDLEGGLDATMEAPPISMAVRQSMESDLAAPVPTPQPAEVQEAPPMASVTQQQEPYSRPDLQLSMAALQQAASVLQSSNQATPGSRNAVSDASQALQNVALLQSMVRLLPTEGMKMKQGRVSRYKGVTPHNTRWQARIKEARRDIHLGYFNTEEAAVRAYDRAVLKFRGSEGLTNLCPADYEEPATVRTPTNVPGKMDASTMTPIDCAETKGANPMPHGYAGEQDDMLPGLVRCPKCGKPRSGDGTQAPPPSAGSRPPTAATPPLPPHSPMQMTLTSTPPTPGPPPLPSPTALVSQAGLSSTLEAYQSVLGSFGSQTVAEFWSAAAAALSPANGIGALSPRDGASSGTQQGGASRAPTAPPVSGASSGGPALPSQAAPPNFARPRPEAIQNVLVHPVTSLATLAAMDALVLREAGIDPELFFNSQQKRRAVQRTSIYRGITRHHGRWQARIKDQRRDIHLGYFDTEIAAARAYDQAALRYRGTKAQLNFPETDYPPELKLEGERRIAAGALQDVEDPIIAQKRKELLGTLRAERAQAKRQKVSTQGGAAKKVRRGGAAGQPDGGGVFQERWQQQQQKGGVPMMPSEVINPGTNQPSGLGVAPSGLGDAPSGPSVQEAQPLPQIAVSDPGPPQSAQEAPPSQVGAEKGGVEATTAAVMGGSGAEPWVPSTESLAPQELHATIPAHS